MIDPRPVLVTGANGFVGSHLVDHLIARDVPVRAMVRKGSDLRWLHPRAETVLADVCRPLTLPGAVAGSRSVIHVAGVVASLRDRTYDEVNAVGTASLLMACRKAAPDLDRFLLVSSLAAAGPSRDGIPVRETDRPRPVSRYGASKLGGEEAARREAGEIPLTIVRPPIVYGPRDTDMLSFFEMAARGIVPAFSREKYYSIVHVRDLVRGIAMAFESPRAAGRTYHLASPRAWSMTRLLSLIAEALNAKPRRLPVPETLLRLVGGPADILARDLGLGGRPLADKVREMLPDFWIADTGAARRDLGFLAEIPLPEGLRETAGFYRAQGWLPGT